MSHEPGPQSCILLLQSERLTSPTADNHALLRVLRHVSDTKKEWDSCGTLATPAAPTARSRVSAPPLTHPAVVAHPVSRHAESVTSLGILCPHFSVVAAPSVKFAPRSFIAEPQDLRSLTLASWLFQNTLLSELAAL